MVITFGSDACSYIQRELRTDSIQSFCSNVSGQNISCFTSHIWMLVCGKRKLMPTAALSENRLTNVGLCHYVIRWKLMPTVAMSRVEPHDRLQLRLCSFSSRVVAMSWLCNGFTPIQELWCQHASGVLTTSTLTKANASSHLLYRPVEWDACPLWQA